MEKVKKFLSKFADMFGFKKSTKYVSDYLHKANMRSGIFMAAIVAILEVWLVIRQHTKYIINDVHGISSKGTPMDPIPYFQSLFNRTSLFWLQMVMGISMFLYCLYYLSEKRSKPLLIGVISASAVGAALCCLLPLENSIKEPDANKLIDMVLLICLYSAILLYHAVVVVAAITRYKGKKIDWLHSIAVISIFALCLLIFGIKVSYGDFTSNKAGVPNPDYKQIICFLMMSLYVGCLLIWRPYISVAILGVVFYGFYFMLKSFDPNIRKFPDGDQVNYITFFISLTMVSISIFNQRLHEARKDERLEQLATVDDLTGLMTYSYFLSESDRKAAEEKAGADKYAFLFFNISSFKVFNDQRGYEAGNKFLYDVGQIIQSTFPEAFVSRQADDHFVAYVENANLIDKFELIRQQVRELDNDLKPNITIGYNIVIDEHEAKAGVEKARYANAYLKQIHKSDYYQYTKKLHDDYERAQYIVSHIDEAIENEKIIPYYQPVRKSKDNTICGVEALARWQDEKYGNPKENYIMNPGLFVPDLERANLVHKLDFAMLDAVCKNMRKVLDSGRDIVPTSINISRSDFSRDIDIASKILKITEKYHINPKYLHIEITESALLDKDADLLGETKRIKKNGFALWLDDFGSDQSSFNSLKDYAFDVLKLDMKFLEGFEENPKCKPIIESVIKMAQSINTGTLCEGVESKEQAEFLKKIGCERLQGWHISKPIPYEILNEKIESGEYILSKEF